MANGKPPKKKVTLEEAFMRLRPMFIAIMAIPLFGMVTAMILLIKLEVNHLPFLLGAIIVVMLIYVSTTYVVFKRMTRVASERVKTPNS